MNTRLISILASLLALSFIFGSCSSDDKNDYKVSEEWIRYQKSLVTKVRDLTDEDGSKVYTPRRTDYGMESYIYQRPSDFITNKKFEEGPIDLEPTPKEEGSGTREVIDEVKYDTDIVILRYHGWLYNEDGKRIIFDSTETDSNGKELNNPKPDVREYIGGFVEGFKVGLHNMKVGDETIICIPHEAGYSTTGRGEIPGYTTLFFSVKLLGVERDR